MLLPCAWADGSPPMEFFSAGHSQPKMKRRVVPFFVLQLSAHPTIEKVRNTAEVPLAITGISISSEFELTNNCPSTVAAGATCTFTVKFAPTQLGGLAGTVTVHDNWSGSAVHPQTVQLGGTGTT